MGVRKIIEDRRMGALVGAIVGDLLGIPYEFAAPSAIPADRLMPVGGGLFLFPPGVGSDDTDLLLTSIEAYNEKGSFDANAALDGMLAWYRNGPRDVGLQTSMALDFWKDDLPPPTDEFAQGNGGIMRAAAHGIMGSSMHSARVNAHEDTLLTHPSQLAADCSAHQALMVWRLINCPTMGMEQVLSTRGPFLEEHKRMMRPYDEDVSELGGHCLHSIRLAKHVLRTSDCYEHGIMRVIRTGGDTDTNASVAGALLGARFGESGIPEDWRNAIAPELRERIDQVRLLVREKEEA